MNSSLYDDWITIEDENKESFQLSDIKDENPFLTPPCEQSFPEQHEDIFDIPEVPTFPVDSHSVSPEMIMQQHEIIMKKNDYKSRYSKTFYGYDTFDNCLICTRKWYHYAVNFYVSTLRKPIHLFSRKVYNIIITFFSNFD